MKIRTAIFGVYVTASAVGFAVLMGLVLRDVRLRYVESMRRTLGDTAVFLASFAAENAVDGQPWTAPFAKLPQQSERLRLFASDPADRVVFDSAEGRDVGQVYGWPMRGGGRLASEDYSVSNVAVVGDELRVRAAVNVNQHRVFFLGVKVGRPDQARVQVGFAVGGLDGPDLGRSHRITVILVRAGEQRFFLARFIDQQRFRWRGMVRIFIENVMAAGAYRYQVLPFGFGEKRLLSLEVDFVQFQVGGVWAGRAEVDFISGRIGAENVFCHKLVLRQLFDEFPVDTIII